MRFYLGTHERSWLARTDVPLFISRRRLERGSRNLPRARGRWALDSGGFTELQLHGRWTVEPAQYADDVRHYMHQVGGLDWAATQDWMCEPFVLTGGTHNGLRFAGTGLTVDQHQARTVESYLQLTDLAPDVPWAPALQGWTLDDYLACLDRYDRNGVDLTSLATVGLGSVCRRQSTAEIAEIVTTLADVGLRNLHGFGVKTQGLSRYGHLLSSADSLAWSYAARHDDPLPGHDQPGPGRRTGHRSCSNCRPYALAWRHRLLHKLAAGRTDVAPDRQQTLDQLADLEDA